jgi:molybdopterin synthase catalytic subunit
MVKIYDCSFNPYIELEKFASKQKKGEIGASCSFIGTMRDFNKNLSVKKMCLFHYETMTKKQLTKIITTVKDKFAINDAMIVHRIGDIKPDDNIVLCVATSSHRNESFLACRFLIEELKNKAPFWKQEITTDGKKIWQS